MNTSDDSGAGLVATCSGRISRNKAKPVLRATITVPRGARSACSSRSIPRIAAADTQTHADTVSASSHQLLGGYTYAVVPRVFTASPSAVPGAAKYMCASPSSTRASGHHWLSAQCTRIPCAPSKTYICCLCWSHDGEGASVEWWAVPEGFSVHSTRRTAIHPIRLQAASEMYKATQSIIP